MLSVRVLIAFWFIVVVVCTFAINLAVRAFNFGNLWLLKAEEKLFVSHLYAWLFRVLIHNCSTTGLVMR